MVVAHFLEFLAEILVLLLRFSHPPTEALCSAASVWGCLDEKRLFLLFCTELFTVDGQGIHLLGWGPHRSLQVPVPDPGLGCKRGCCSTQSRSLFYLCCTGAVTHIKPATFTHAADILFYFEPFFAQFASISWSADPHLLVFLSLFPVDSSWITVQKQKQFSD